VSGVRYEIIGFAGVVKWVPLGADVPRSRIGAVVDVS
jgi:hypothetical protein